MHDPALVKAPLGREISYPDAYDASLLFPIDRSTNRAALSLPESWYGADIWNAYEVSWLTPKGKPVVALARFIFPQNSPRLVESKSFKLYLNSFSEERFDSTNTVRTIMQADLSLAAGADVNIELNPLSQPPALEYGSMEGINIDDTDIEISTYEPTPGLLQCLPAGKNISETLVSDLLKSNCPVTGQPDWGSVQVRYTGLQIDRDALLRYIVSLRRHTEFHEHCVEKMYCDIWQACKPTSLFVYARYTRRGGLDINPWRSSEPAHVSHARTARQ
ncbi:NADPH-dependent 7-cyano-7-deazaguanine reductase QueF [Pollutimonas harenae]|uniref:NADPH-dependent 7-cyano-7-deazaguanine reductase n=1 Tax=Pollutimonas harenae TaxID=657015 RepID=A0A853GU09_9BURK|nr:NADPH-dependent 7-cyano-7-deazaguanine reductase QueF [Pollutimonas harenae]NYT85741.1 NADPH-dependent 7-cyano-7-deazaguanine reductase QueF [Pollutimonas harenae]TEA70807.1 NADPH-dependent 7-cyano-7-deazaguanine reductase QueF [Pollutimonas harenae]